MAERLIKPPIRTALMNNADGTPMTQISAVNRPGSSSAPAAGSASADGGQLTIQKHWYRYWGDCGDQINANTDKLDSLVTYGTHAGRPDPATMPDGALYFEEDRSLAQYENIAGKWYYVSGTMWGSLSPDTRPTDLGPADAGFTFRGTDKPYEYIWSGGAWVETPAIDYRVNSALVGTRQALNLIAGANVTLSGADNAAASRVDVTIASSGGGTGGAVSSVFGRTGAVLASTGDYAAAQVTNAVDSTQAYANPAWITSLAYSKITGAPAAPVASVFGRTGAIVAATGDYTAAQVTNAVDSTQTYSNPAFISTLAWSKITGAPSVSSYQTPWLSDINGASFRLLNPAGIGIATSSPAATLDCNGSMRALKTTAVHPATGAGLELIYSSSTDQAFVTSYDRDAGAYKPLAINGSQVGIAGSVSVLLQQSGGNVGVGSASPQGSMHCARADGSYQYIVERSGATDPHLYGVAISGAAGNPALLINDVTAGAVRLAITPAGNVGIGGVTAPTYLLQLASDSAAKPGTNTWTIASDIRTKRNVERFEGDIDVIRRLDPIVAEYNGLGGTPEGARVVSFDAAKLREIVPQCVSGAKGKLRQDDAEETELLGVNTHELFFHLLRAVQQIDRRLAALEEKTP